MSVGETVEVGVGVDVEPSLFTEVGLKDTSAGLVLGAALTIEEGAEVGVALGLVTLGTDGEAAAVGIAVAS